MVTLAGLFIYPVKSCRGIALDAAVLADAGLEHDREWMIVTPDGRFLTQREEPRLALISARLQPDSLWLSAPGAAPLEVPFSCAGAPTEVVVWRDHCHARDEGDGAARWLHQFLGRPLRLVRFDESHRRRSDETWTGDTPGFTRFADGYALLVISQASLADLSTHLSRPLPMNRFRPNLVLEGLPPYGEDDLGEFGVGDGIRLKAVKPCIRCAITTTDQATGKVDGAEPLRTLRRYRWNSSLRGVEFGQNVIVVEGAGRALELGMEIRVA